MLATRYDVCGCAGTQCILLPPTMYLLVSVWHHVYAIDQQGYVGDGYEGRYGDRFQWGCFP